tara:strand:+ start:40 stop:714 length:675 start_codon:yes stop_codon:yes gene_type:complete
MKKLKRKDFNLYLNWLPYALLGKLAEADSVLENNKASILRAARWFNQAHARDIRLKGGAPQPPPTVWRGVLLDPSINPADELLPRPMQTFESWTEERDVATWFALKDSVMNKQLLEANPTHEGYLAKCNPENDEILWRHNWKATLEHHMEKHCTPQTNTIEKIIAYLAKDGEEARQHIAQAIWTQLTQQEVILLPKLTVGSYFPIDSLPHLTTAELDIKYNIPS